MVGVNRWHPAQRLGQYSHRSRLQLVRLPELDSEKVGDLRMPPMANGIAKRVFVLMLRHAMMAVAIANNAAATMAATLDGT
jgi:hypothetical protein